MASVDGVLARPTARLGDLDLGGAAFGESIRQAVQPASQRRHHRVRIGVVPSLEVTHHGERSRQDTAQHVDDVPGGRERPAGIAGVVVGIEGQHHRAGAVGGEPGIISGGVGIIPVAALDGFPKVVPGGGRQGNRVHPIACQQVAVGAVVIERLTGVIPAVERPCRAPRNAGAAAGAAVTG